MNATVECIESRIGQEMRGPGFGLEWLLFALSREEFVERYYESKATYIDARNRPGLDDLFSWSAAEQIVWLLGMEAARFVKIFSSESERTLPSGLTRSGLGQHVWECYSQGMSIVINSVELFWLPVARLVADIESSLNLRASVNCYITPPDCATFAAHFDVHDVVVLQVAGSRPWCVYGVDKELPLPEMNKRVDHDALGEPVFERVFQPGDTLYLPRGQIHYAGAAELSSIHLTIGLYPIKWVDVIAGLVQSVATTDSNAVLRESVNSTRLPQVYDLLQELVLELDHSDLERAVNKERHLLTASRSILPNNLSRSRITHDRESIQPSDFLSKKSGMSCWVEIDETRVLLSHSAGWPGTDRTLRPIENPLVLRDAVEFIAWSEGEFTLTLHKSGLERVLAVKPPCEARR